MKKKMMILCLMKVKKRCNIIGNNKAYWGKLCQIKASAVETDPSDQMNPWH